MDGDERIHSDACKLDPAIEVDDLDDEIIEADNSEAETSS